MKLNNIIVYTATALSAMLFNACTKGFENLNTNPTVSSSAQPSQMILGIERKAADIVYDNTVNGTVGNLYAQYYAQTQRTTQSQFQIDEGSNNMLWSLYSIPLSNAANLIENNEKDPEPGAQNENAIANIISVWLFEILTDTYGNVPYSNALLGDNGLAVSYDNSTDIYDSLIDNLDAQISALDTSKAAFTGTGEVIYNNDITKWKKLANSLKLRIGIRMCLSNAATAKKIIAEAVQSGVFTSNDDEAKFPYQSGVGSQFPYNDSSGNVAHIDYWVTSTLINYLKQTSDPRLSIYARPAANGTSGYAGQRYGNSSVGSLDDYSMPGVKVYSPTFPGYIMSYSEVAFDLAEAAARGYISGSAADYYNDAVKASMQFWGVSDADAQTFLDKNPYDGINSIALQKWVSLYNQGMQGWFERNRLFPNKSGASIFIAPSASLDPNIDLSSIIVPYRMSYPTAEDGQNRTNYRAAIQALGGVDSKAIKLWWQQ